MVNFLLKSLKILYKLRKTEKYFFIILVLNLPHCATYQKHKLCFVVVTLPSDDGATKSTPAAMAHQ